MRNRDNESVLASRRPSVQAATVLRSNQRVYEHACELDSLRPRGMRLRAAGKAWIHSGLPACCAPTIRKKQSRSYFEDDNDSGTPWVWHACGWNFEVLKVLNVLKVVTFHVSSIQDFTNSLFTSFTNSPIPFHFSLIHFSLFITFHFSLIDFSLIHFTLFTNSLFSNSLIHFSLFTKSHSTISKNFVLTTLTHFSL